MDKGSAHRAPVRKVYIAANHRNDLDFAKELMSRAEQSDLEFSVGPPRGRYAVGGPGSYALKLTVSHAINPCSHVLVVVGEQTQSDAWVDWEVDLAINLRKRLAAVYLDPNFEPPDALKFCVIELAKDRSLDSIRAAILRADRARQ